MNKRKFWRRSLGSVATLVLWAVLLSALLLSSVNDMYAFFKPEGTVTLTLSADLSIGDLCRTLDGAEVIGHPLLFYLYIKDEADLSPSGTVTLRRDMSYRELRAALRESSAGKN